MLICGLWSVYSSGSQRKQGIFEAVCGVLSVRVREGVGVDG